MSRKYDYYDEYDEEDIYDDNYDEDEYEDEEKEEDDFDEKFGDNEEDDDALPVKNTPAYYSKGNEPDFVQIMEDYNSGVSYKVDAAVTKALESQELLIRSLISSKYKSYAKKHYDDLLQQGRLAVCAGLSKYDPTKGKPSTYFYPLIVHEMQDYVNQMINNTTPHYDTSVRHIKKVLDQYEKEGRKYTAVDIRIDTGYPMQTIEHALNLIHSRELSIESAPEAIGSLENVLSSDEMSPEQYFFEREKIRTINDAMTKYLSKTEIMILEMTHGLHGCEEENIKTISRDLKMTADQVRRGLKEAERKLRRCSEFRSFFKDHLKDDFITVDDPDAVQFVCAIDLDAAINNMKDIEIDF